MYTMPEQAEINQEALDDIITSSKILVLRGGMVSVSRYLNCLL
jgi:hypothetical protein